MRHAVLIAVLVGAAAFGHVFSFDFLLSKPVGNYADDAGRVPLQWFDSESAGGAATVRVFASRRAQSPFQGPQPEDTMPVGGPIALASPIDFLDWDTRDAGGGCWQPYALVDDPVEGQQVFWATGKVTIARGGVPPALWVTTPLAATADDAGRLMLQWELDAPDDPSVTTIEWVVPNGERGTLATGLPLPAGTRSATYTVDLARLPSRPVWLHLEVRSGDGGWCDAWWRGSVVGRSGDGGFDAGPDEDGGSDAGDGGHTGRCGCSGGGAPLLLAALA